jgi:hypothetical protein
MVPDCSRHGVLWFGWQMRLRKKVTGNGVLGGGTALGKAEGLLCKRLKKLPCATKGGTGQHFIVCALTVVMKVTVGLCSRWDVSINIKCSAILSQGP